MNRLQRELQREEKLRFARYLNEHGCPAQLESRSPELIVEQVFAVGTNIVFDLKDGQSGYVLDVALTSHSDRPIRFEGIRIKTPWGGSGISMLEPGTRYHIPGGYYSFPDDSLDFDRSVVLNRLLSGKCRLNPRGEAEGVIMAVDPQSIPDDIPDNGRIVVELLVFDGPGNQFPSQFRLFVDRSARRRARQRAHRRAGGSACLSLHETGPRRI
jgi:hypothetical protein